MAATLRIDNFGSLNLIETSRLEAEHSASATTLTMQSTQGLSTGSLIMIGRPGSEESELRTIDTVTNATSATITSGLTRAHSKYTPTVTLLANQARIYRAANVDGSVPDDDDFSAYAVITLDTDQMYTTYTDSSGSSSYWYKATYYNSTASQESALADAKAARPGTNYATNQSIRLKAGYQNNPYITDAMVDEKRRVAQSIIDADLMGIYTVPFSAPINDLIAEITRLLAAGMLLNNTEGAAMVTEGKTYLQRLVVKELVLPDAIGEDTSLTDSGGFNMWPNTDTASADAEDGGSERMFRTSYRY